MRSANRTEDDLVTRRLRFGIVGAGFAQNVHLPLLKADARCEIVALCASSSEKAERIAALHGIPGAFGSWQEMLDKSRLDAITIAVPPALQPEIIVAAAKRGIHTFCEKPLAADYRSAEEAAKAVEQSRIISAVDFSFPELSTWKALKRVLQDGTLGALRSFTLSWQLESYANRMGIQSWKTRADEGGGALNSLASHSFYYLEWLFGPIDALRATLLPSAEFETRVQLSLRFFSGVTGSVDISTDTFAGRGHSLEVSGANGSARLVNEGEDYMKGFRLEVATRNNLSTEEIRTEPVITTDGRFLGTGPIMDRFIQSILCSTQMTPRVEDGLRVQRFIDRARKANHDAEWIAVE